MYTQYKDCQRLCPYLKFSVKTKNEEKHENKYYNTLVYLLLYTGILGIRNFCIKLKACSCYIKDIYDTILRKYEYTAFDFNTYWGLKSGDRGNTIYMLKEIVKLEVKKFIQKFSFVMVMLYVASDDTCI